LNAFIKTYCCYWDIRKTRFKTSTSLLGHKTY
jgi:hypothetical protein